MLNYIDFAEAYRSRDDLIHTAEELLARLDLGNDRLATRPLEILEEHKIKGNDHSRLLNSLVALAAFQASRRHMFS